MEKNNKFKPSAQYTNVLYVNFHEFGWYISAVDLQMWVFLYFYLKLMESWDISRWDYSGEMHNAKFFLQNFDS